jgi:hypothetical protein
MMMRGSKAAKQRSARRSNIRTERAVEVPHWVPLIIREFAENYIVKSEDGTQNELYIRLLRDPRMERVWNELMRRKRKDYFRTDHFVNPATVPGSQSLWTERAKQIRRRLTPGSKDDMLVYNARLHEKMLAQILIPWRAKPVPSQELALAYFFSEVVRNAINPPGLIRLADAKRIHIDYLKKAKELRQDATVWNREGKFGSDRLRKAADAYEEMARAAITNPLVTSRKPRTSGAACKGFVIALSEVNKGIFGRQLLGTVANVANVIFDHDDLSSAKLGKMLRTYPP